MAVWDVAALPEREQFGYWHEVICEAFVPLTPHRTVEGPGFPARVETRPLREVVRAHITSQPQRTVHGPGEVRRTDGAYYFLNLQLAGRCTVRQGRVESVVGPGQFTLVDTTEPYWFDLDAPWRMLSYRLPHALVDGRDAVWRAHLGSSRDGLGAGAVVAAMLAALWDVDVAGSGPAAAAELEQALVAAVSAVAGGDADVPPRVALRTAVLRHVRARLGDPALSVTSVSRRFGVAPRTLHAAFADGETFAATVRRLRLERAAALLADPGTAATVTGIAASVGLPDPASFSRAFRRHFGCAPSEMRPARNAQPTRAR